MARALVQVCAVLNNSEQLLHQQVEGSSESCKGSCWALNWQRCEGRSVAAGLSAVFWSLRGPMSQNVLTALGDYRETYRSCS